jgi:hypothetical protein
MNTSETLLVSGKALSTVCESAELDDDVLVRLDEAEELPTFLEGLSGDGLHEPAIAFLAQALPSRQAVGWAWVCAREVTGEDAPAEVEACLEATRAWIQDPTDELRRAAFDAADVAGMDTPAGAAGLAAFFSGDSLAPPDSDPAPPPEGLVGRTVAGCIHISAACGEPEDVVARYEDFIRRGMELAERVSLWQTKGAGPEEQREP